jgi:ribonucleotide reductase beta subunit family protein with ferritin-like domain
VTKYQFRQLFTLQERISIDNAQYNITLSGSQKAAVVTILKDLTVADEIQLSNPEVAASLLFMSVIGLVTEARVDRILINAPPY